MVVNFQLASGQSSVLLLLFFFGKVSVLTLVPQINRTWNLVLGLVFKRLQFQFQKSDTPMIRFLLTKTRIDGSKPPNQALAQNWQEPGVLVNVIIKCVRNVMLQLVYVGRFFYFVKNLQFRFYGNFQNSRTSNSSFMKKIKLQNFQFQFYGKKQNRRTFGCSSLIFQN